METAGRLCQTPIQEHRPILAFHRNALQIAVICLMLLLEPNCSPATQAKIWEDLSGEKALAHVQRLVDFGPRPSGSEAIENSRRYIEDQLRRSGWQVKRQALRLLCWWKMQTMSNGRAKRSSR